jgi:hypothetical protein
MMRNDPEEIPPILHENYYPHIGHYLVRDVRPDGNGRRPHTAACLMDPDELAPPVDLNYHVTAMKRQLNQVFLWPHTLHPREEFHQPVDAFMAATADSIPLFDVVRGFYSTLPQDKRRSKPDFLPPLDCYTPLPKARLLGKHVCIISHHIDSAYEPVERAAAQLYKDGAGQVSAIRTHAYEHAIDYDIDYDNLTSRHRERLQAFGKLCVWHARS